MLDGAVVLHMDLTTDYSPPRQGFVVAQAAGDVVSIVYAFSDDEALLDQLATRLATDAQDLLAAAVPSG